MRMNDQKNNPEWGYSSFTLDQGYTGQKINWKKPRARSSSWWSRWGGLLIVIYVFLILATVYTENVLQAKKGTMFTLGWWGEVGVTILKDVQGLFILTVLVVAFCK